MRAVTDEYISQVKSGARQFGFCVSVYGNGEEPDMLWLGDLISIEITRSISDQLQIGACMSDRLTLQTRATTLFNGKGKKVVVYYRCTAPVLDWIKLGTFYVDECVTEQGVTAVTASDKMSRFDKRMTWTGDTAPTFPCAMQDMLDYICGRMKITTDFVCQDFTIDKAPDGYTARELISYVATSHGCNARLSPSEVLKIRPYTQTSEVVSYGECFALDVSSSDNGYEVKGILFDRGGDDKIFIDGTSAEYDDYSDGIVQAYNPFATVAIAEYAWNNLGGLKYSAADVVMPALNILEPGDVFTIRASDGSETNAIVMEQILSVSCTGGFVERISCTAESKNQTRNAENRAEATEKAANSDYAKYLQTADSAAVMQTLPGGFVCGKMCFMEDSQGGFRCLSSDGANINVDTSIFIRSGKNHQIIVDDGTILVLVGGAVIRVNVGGDINITNGTDANIRLTSNSISAKSGTAKLELKGNVELIGDSTGLKYNGTYIT